MSELVQLSADNLFVIKQTKIVEEVPEFSYYETPAMWTTKPTKATLFQTFEAASATINMFDLPNTSEEKITPGTPLRPFEVVPYYAELLISTEDKHEHIDPVAEIAELPEDSNFMRDETDESKAE